jgi:signal transduction histidine kinase
MMPGRRGSLSGRLAWLTFATVLAVEAVVFLPVLSRARQDWLDRRLRDGQLAALSAGLGSAPEGLRLELLHLARVDGVRLEQPDRTLTVLAPGATFADGPHIDLSGETVLGGTAAAMASLLRGGDALLQVSGPVPLPENATVTVLVHRRDLDRYIGRRIGHAFILSLVVALLAGALLHAVLDLGLVRPIRRLTASIAAFRADPERAAAFDPSGMAWRGGDEIADAARELAAMQRELRAALWRNARLAALGTAVAKVSHDLRGILSPALLTAERLQMSQEPSIKRAGDTLVRAVERATDLVRRTVEFARETPIAPQRQRIALRPVVEEAAEQARAACPALSVENGVPATLEIDAERDSVLRILANLLRNAGEAQARRVRVSAEPEPAMVVVVVTDDGPGLPPQVREALFHPFVAGGHRGGAGLGLAIARDLVRAHGGEIALLETGAAGTSFRLTLPAARRAAALPPPSGEQARPADVQG